jgi:hypothetical protein
MSKNICNMLGGTEYPNMTCSTNNPKVVCCDAQISGTDSNTGMPWDTGSDIQWDTADTDSTAFPPDTDTTKDTAMMPPDTGKP